MPSVGRVTWVPRAWWGLRKGALRKLVARGAFVCERRMGYASWVNSVLASRVARTELHGLGRRLDHVSAVAQLAGTVSATLSGAERDLLASAAWLHDIGYGLRIRVTGFHPLDGGRWLAARGEVRLAGLVANHTGAAHEARLRGLEAELASFPAEASAVADLLTWCDLCTGPEGQRMTPERRISEIVERYGQEHVVSRSVLSAHDDLLAACDRVDSLLGHVN